MTTFPPTIEQGKRGSGWEAPAVFLFLFFLNSDSDLEKTQAPVWVRTHLQARRVACLGLSSGQGKSSSRILRKRNGSGRTSGSAGAARSRRAATVSAAMEPASRPSPEWTEAPDEFPQPTGECGAGPGRGRGAAGGPAKDRARPGPARRGRGRLTTPDPPPQPEAARTRGPGAVLQ